MPGKSKVKKETGVEFITSRQWGSKFSPPISLRSVQRLFEENRIKGAKKVFEFYGRIYFRGIIVIPINTKDPRKPKGRPLLTRENIKKIPKSERQTG